MQSAEKPKMLPLATLEDMFLYAERYCLGRSTYAVKDYCNYVKPLVPYMSNRFLSNINRDFLNNERWGMEMDKQEWGKLWNAVLDEIQHRTAKGEWQR